MVKKLLFVFLVLGLLIRLWNFPVWNGFDYDQEINAWIAKTIVIDHKPVLIGPETSIGGMYVGPFFNYIIALFFVFSRMDPAVSVILNSVIFAVTLLAFTKVAGELLNRRARIIAMVFYTFSAMIVGYDRVLWNPTPIPMISLLVFFFLTKFLDKGQNRDLFLSSFFLGFMFHLHFQAILIGAIFFLSLLLFKRESLLKPATYLAIIPILMIFFLPLVVFDLRHDFINSRHLWQFFFSRSGSADGTDIFAFVSTLTVLDVSFRDLTYAFTNRAIPAVAKPMVLFPIVIGIYLLRNLRQTIFRLALVSFAVTLLAFTFYKGPLPTQYYFLFLYPLFILAASDAISKLPDKAVYLLTTLFILANVWQIIDVKNDLSLENKHRAVSYIARDAGGQSFKVDMITAPGLATGYKYLFWLEGTNPSFDYLAKTEKSYKLVVPSTIARPEELSARFGSIGVVKSK